MNPVLLHKQLKNNATDLQDFYKDLKTWGADMKRKEDSRQQSNNNNNNNTLSADKKRKIAPAVKQPEKVKPEGRKVACTNYAAWDKFDADAECEKVDYDENEESDLTDECDESSRDLAYVEKEKGNKFVKDKKWDEAIACYSTAINYHAYDPVFYANRALCYLKKQDFSEAESDCTMSIKLDKTYAKAYLRRAAAREALNKLQDAEVDLLQVLELEPKNSEAKSNLDNLRKKRVEVEDKVQRPVSKFTISRGKAGIKSTSINSSGVTNNNVTKIIANHWPTEENIILVKTIKKPVHSRSKKPLKRIEIKEIDVIGDTGTAAESVRPFPRNEHKLSFNTDDLHIIEKQPIHEKIKENNNSNNLKINEAQRELTPPINSVQFYSVWRHFKTLESKYTYLKLINPEDLPNIFKESLDSKIYSEVLEVLAEKFIESDDDVYCYLAAISKIRRFSTITLFMSDDDKDYVKKLFDYVRLHGGHPKDEVDQLFKKYEL